MARVPDRTRDTYFLGAGFSRSLNLPNTAELLGEVHTWARAGGLAIDRHLREAYRYFYPEEAATFVPETVDFFSVLRAYQDVASGLPGAFPYASLLADLRMAVVQILCNRTRDIAIPDDGWLNVDRIIRPGNVIITSNWDPLVEHYARVRGIPLRLGGRPSDHQLTLIKLHGSIDWTARDERRPDQPTADFAAIRELQNSPRSYSVSIAGERVLRIRAVENMNRSWQFIKARTRRPLMVMMSQGKTVDLVPILGMWADAYYALSATRHLRVIGYSMPADDIEIRTLLRAGIARGRTHRGRVTVLNPETGVHVRMRTYVLRGASSDYSSFVPG
jgi:hypothetical protein